ncbi:DMT family transporter [Deefgea piscis]|uniref:DMT family transporter n=1 Tax=Deefgea piscis TaxID=2739061 RepID=UPI001C7E8C02|nr:EamA family transporter [Deefgea piscis]QZA79661.1 DMT family transporter [Deefgea piscis]
MSIYATYSKLALVSLIWGGTFVAGRYLSADVPPLLSACLRFFLASMTLIIIISIKNNLIIELSKSQILRLITLGFFGVFSYNIFFFYGLHYTDASRASLIVALNPALIALTAFFIEKEKISRINLIGIIGCVVGAITVILSKSTISNSNSELWKGDLLILGCVISWVIYTVFAKKIVLEIGPIHTVTYSVVAGTGMLFMALIFQDGDTISAMTLITQKQILSLVYLGVIGSAIAYILYYDGIQSIGATKAGGFIALNPLSAVILSFLILGENLSISMLLGGIIAITGIYFCNK